MWLVVIFGKDWESEEMKMKLKNVDYDKELFWRK